MASQFRSFDGREEDQHSDEVYAVHWLESGPTVSGSLDGQLRIWDTDVNFASLGSINHDSPHRCVKSISSSLETGQVLSSDIMGTVALWEVDTTQRAVEEDCMEGDGPSSSSSSMSLIAEKDLTERNCSRGIDQEGRKRQHRACFASQVHPSLPLFVTTGSRGGLSIYDIEPFGNFRAYYNNNSHSQAEADQEHFGQSIRINERGDMVAVGTDKGKVSIYDLESGKTIESIQGQSCITRAIEFMKSGEILIGSDQNSVAIYDLRAPFTGSLDGEASTRTQDLRASYVQTLKGHKFWITDVKVSLDQKCIATTSADGCIKLWDRRNRAIIFQIKEERPVWSLSWGKASSSFVSGSGLVEKNKGASGNVRWYQISGTAT